MNDEKPEVGDFNAHLSSLVKPKLATKSEITASNTSWFFKIVFPDIPELNGVELVVPLSMKKWPHYTYDEIFRCINAQYPAITSPSFNGQSYRLQIYLEGQDVEGFGPKEQTKDLPNGATVELRYRPLRETEHGREEVRGAGAGAAADAGASLPRWPLGDPGDNWRFGEWNESWDEEPAAAPPLAVPAAPALAAPALAAPALAAPALAAPAAAAPADPFPPILHPASNMMTRYDPNLGQYREPRLDPVSGEWMTYDPVGGFYGIPTLPWRGGQPPAGRVMEAPPPMIYPNNGGSQTPGPYPYGGKKPQSKHGKKKSKSKSKTKKSKSKSKRNNRRSYKR